MRPKPRYHTPRLKCGCPGHWAGGRDCPTCRRCLAHCRCGVAVVRALPLALRREAA